MDKSFEQGWNTASNLTGSEAAALTSEHYVQNVANAIQKLSDDLYALNAPTQASKINGGFMAEAWHADTFNVNAAVKNSPHRATRLGVNTLNSVDIDTNFGKTYSSKYMATAEKTAAAQGKLDLTTRQPAYAGQDPLVPKDQLEDVKKTAHNRSLKNTGSRPEVARSYHEVEKHATDRISDGKVTSDPLTKKESTKLDKDVKKGKLDLDERGVSTQKRIEAEDVLRNAVGAGLMSAAINAALAVAPDIVEELTQYFKNGEVNPKEFQRVGLKALSAGSDGFLKGSLSSTFVILCQSGKLGESLIKASPDVIASLVVITLCTIEDGVRLALGNLNAREMGGHLVDNAVVTLSFLGAMKIGGTLGQSIAPELPIVGYLIGSAIGCGIALTYGMVKKPLIAFCRDSGFTNFGLVEQDYTLPEEALKDMGVELADIEVASIETASIEYANLAPDPSEVPAFKMIRRGVFSFNKIGYVYQ
jgi:hypothetical protein